MTLDITPLKQKLKTGPCIGTLVSVTSPDVVEILSLTGMDWLMIDLEHSTIDAEGIKSFSRAAGGRCAIIARVPGNDEIWIKKVLDAGADGIIVPQVNSAAEAKRVVQYAKYRPVGERGVGIGRAQGFGAQFKQYIETANDNILVAAQIEHIDAVNAADAIAAVPGIDALFIGPYDLSDSMGQRGNVTHPQVAEAIAKTKRACDAQKIPAGIFAGDAEAAASRIAEGYRLLAVGTDAMHLRAGVQPLLTLTEQPNERATKARQ